MRYYCVTLHLLMTLSFQLPLHAIHTLHTIHTTPHMTFDVAVRTIQYTVRHLPHSTLAGSTIMLLTIPWLGSLILGRVDIINGQGRDKQCSPFTLSSLWKQVHKRHWTIKSSLISYQLGYHCFARCHSKCHCDVDYNASLLVSANTSLSISTNGRAVVSIVQGADWHYGPTKPSSGDPDPKKYIKDAALVTGILSLILFVLYLVYQVLCTVICSETDIVCI